ncbi:MAG: YheU family protein [Pseudomonadales bacterium]|nr:YheU family protein [Pseudomonadales bacterium]
MSGLVIPWQSLSAESLRGVIEEVISREGTDYGLFEASLDQKVLQIRTQLERHEVTIVFDSELDSCSIVSITDLDI